MDKAVKKAVRALRKAGLEVYAPSQSSQKIRIRNPKTGEDLRTPGAGGVPLEVPKTPSGEYVIRDLAHRLRDLGYEVPGLTDRRR